MKIMEGFVLFVTGLILVLPLFAFAADSIYETMKKVSFFAIFMTTVFVAVAFYVGLDMIGKGIDLFIDGAM